MMKTAASVGVTPVGMCAVWAIVFVMVPIVPVAPTRAAVTVGQAR